ncbi:MAG: hypothetical protein ACJ790_06790 [Myxococcaceae bacterium]
MIPLSLLVVAIASATPEVSSNWGDTPPSDRALSVGAGVAFSLDTSFEPAATRQGELIAVSYDFTWDRAPDVPFGRFGFRVGGDAVRLDLGQTSSLYSLSAAAQLRWVAFDGPVRPYLASGMGVRSIWVPRDSSRSGLQMELPLALGIELHPSERLRISLEGEGHSPVNWSGTYAFFVTAGVRVGYRF